MPQAILDGPAGNRPVAAEIPLVPPRLNVLAHKPQSLLRGLQLTICSHELFEEYTRRQFLAKAPKLNPFGDDETPAKFADFDVFTKVCLASLHHMAVLC